MVMMMMVVVVVVVLVKEDRKFSNFFDPGIRNEGKILRFPPT
jgi:hypothetical protein